MYQLRVSSRAVLNRKIRQYLSGNNHPLVNTFLEDLRNKRATLEYISQFQTREQAESAFSRKFNTLSMQVKKLSRELLEILAQKLDEFVALVTDGEEPIEHLGDPEAAPDSEEEEELSLGNQQRRRSFLATRWNWTPALRKYQEIALRRAKRPILSLTKQSSSLSNIMSLTKNGNDKDFVASVGGDCIDSVYQEIRNRYFDDKLTVEDGFYMKLRKIVNMFTGAELKAGRQDCLGEMKHFCH
ncbi:hypothetical protein BX666DRAFT_2022787 [Dichotomocladium elegans]|nr:hypothetical protein BX666DRAFT_2022787 [Dichotomocladium elegans]